MNELGTRASAVELLMGIATAIVQEAKPGDDAYVPLVRLLTCVFDAIEWLDGSDADGNADD